MGHPQGRRMRPVVLPTENPTMIGAEIAGLSYPAREVGGDYYDFIDLGEQRVGIVLGDVSGKGVSAALFML